MIKKLVLITLTSCSLFSCSTVELIHEPVGCLGQYDVSLGLTQAEYEAIDLSVEQKIIIFTKTLRARIDAQCEINLKHDINHGEKEND